ncbi:MAG: GNAT family N-acetyltransferase [Candidatus Omnitrophota bacterium]|jgi:O-antigen/teichoic acid export membrane protein/ribosomal protein S18 acetylase RimI-like enzyme
MNAIRKFENIRKESGIWTAMKRAAGKVIRPVIETNSAFWFEKELTGRLPEIPIKLQLEIDFSSREETIGWLKKQHEPWMYNEHEIKTAREKKHCFPSVKYLGKIIGYAKAGTGKVYIEDYRQEISLPREKGFIYDLYVDKKFRGKGIAAYLMNELMAELKKQGVKKIGCHIPGWNNASAAVFEKLGFKKIKYVRHFRVLKRFRFNITKTGLLCRPEINRRAPRNDESEKIHRNNESGTGGNTPAVYRFKIIGDYAAIILGTGFGRGLSFVTSLLLARALGTTGFGIYSVFFTIMMLSWQMLGVFDGIYVRYAKAGHQEEHIDYLRAIFFMKLMLFFVMSCAAYPAGYAVSAFFFQKPELTFYVSSAVIAGAFLSVFTTLGGILLAKERFNIYSVFINVFYTVFFLFIGAGVLLKLNLTPLETTLLNTMLAALMGGLGIWYLWRKTKPVFFPKPFLIKNMVHFGKWLLAESVIYNLIQRLDILFLARTASYDQVGIYSAAVRTAMFAGILTTASTTLFMPKGCASLRSKGQLSAYLKESLLLNSALAGIIVLLITVSPTLIRVLFGQHYVPAIPAARLLLLDAIFILFYTPFSFLFLASGKTKMIFYFGLTKLCVISAGLALLVPRMGPTGAAFAICLTSLCGLGLAVAASSKLIKNVTD